LKIEVGGYNPLIGKSYGELAAESRSQHKSQGFGVPAARGSQLEYFSALEGKNPVKSLTEDIDLGWSRINAPQITSMIKRIVEAYSAEFPARSVPALVNLYRSISKLPATYWRDAKLKDLEEIISAASGLWIEAYTTKPFAVQNDTIRVNIVLNNRNGTSSTFNAYSIDGKTVDISKPAASNTNLSYSELLKVPSDKHLSQPYWLMKKMSVGAYDIDDQQLIGRPTSPAPYVVDFDVTIAGEKFRFSRNVFYKHTDPVKGELYQPLTVVPAGSGGNAGGALRHISYNHIPDIYYFNNDTAQVKLGNVKIAGKRIGYIEGAGDKVPAALRLMGYEVTLLKEGDLRPGSLQQYDAIITGVRAYNVHPFLTSRNDILNDYVKGGGNLIVQYNTNSFVGPINANIGPYPFVISRERITDEQSPVRFIDPSHPVLNYPNKLSNEDFENWVQERGIYFADKLDTAFQTPLGMNDPGEKEQRGSLIIARHGKGTFVYTGIVFFRQLPAGVEGAYRLLANIIALNKKIE
jgi:hypothetical protein